MMQKRPLKSSVARSKQEAEKRIAFAHGMKVEEYRQFIASLQPNAVVSIARTSQKRRWQKAASGLIVPA